MNIKFAGVGAAFATADHYQSNMIVTAPNGKRLLVDCGSDARFSLAESGCSTAEVLAGLDGVYISHLHADHVGGLEWYAFSTYFNPDLPRPRLIAEESLLEPLWQNVLKGGLCCIEGKTMGIADYFHCQPVRAGTVFEWEGVRMTPLRMPHVTTDERSHYSYGLLVEGSGEPGTGVFISTDAQFEPALLATVLPRVALVFHDCETMSPPTGVHAHYEQLRTLPAEWRAKMWLYHYQPAPELDPVADGFRGFVAKGQEFRVALD